MPVQEERSTDPLAFQNLPQAIGAMSKSFADGHVIAAHDHDRDQLLYATSGIMRLQTEREAWIVPPDRAAYIPAGTRHSVSMRGKVEMRTLYIDAAGSRTRPDSLCVVAVSNLLRELVMALAEEPVVYAPGSRGGLIAQLIELELLQARKLSLQVPLPKDPRLQRLCARLLANPSDRRTLEAWSEVAGASPRTLARLFESDLGMSFRLWRQRIRFQSAMEALSRGEAVSRVAQSHGYRSVSAFSAAFGKVMGMPPSNIQTE